MSPPLAYARGSGTELARLDLVYWEPAIAPAVLLLSHGRLFAVLEHLTNDRRVSFHPPRVFLELRHRDSMIVFARSRGHAAREGGVLFERTERGPQRVFQFLGLIRKQAFGRERVAYVAAKP